MKLIAKFQISLIAISYLSLLLGLYFGEDTIGGMEHDYNLLQKNMMFEGFKNGLSDFLYNYYPSAKYNHSPVYYVFIFYMQNIFGSLITKIILLHVYLLLPYLYLKTIKFKFKKTDFFIYIIVIFFLSSSFRSIAIWSGREILVSIFLILSIFNFLKFIKNCNFSSIFKSLTFLIICSYISPEAGIISIIYFFESYKILSKKKFLYLLFFSLLCSIPFFYYLRIYLTFNDSLENVPYIDFFKNLPFFFSSILIYTIPFILIKRNEYFSYLIKNKYLFFLLCLIFFFLNFNVETQIGGGGIEYFLKKINLEIILFLFSSLGLLNLFFIFKKDINYNAFITIIFVIHTCLNIYFFQKYIDIYWFVYFLFFFKSEDIKEYFNNRKFKKYFILLYLLIYFGNMIAH